ncbi:uncharacterized protein SPPG_05139 [Spizellomyces punctatus DAOM BR117]|uniref:DUF7630 domain-containing protein n=1 Tax=Spizellomyces punctatus (strain DAOM BR117) TaxID=645134 RepID=A0A0L0HF67_SPIPD|nr:uncharacterized protein SPPG_05139 [Spizellomyces punctatus DAOM BR117]KNC99762.1 hypothetical protein SPPG_05139 [Spizellomyces punctatus DAOM BR117]|eukprot:XP_016607802.1 hypothetical protein SPPG_05139 [Spizellomyces punctatus DAOM BR117]
MAIDSPAMLPAPASHCRFIILLFLLLYNIRVDAQPWPVTYISATTGQDTVGCGAAVDTACKGLQAGINSTAEGGLMWVQPGIYQGPGNVDLKLAGKAIRMQSTHGAQSTIIDGGKANRILSFNTGDGNDAFISGFTFRNGAASWGGCIGIGGSAAPIIEDSIFTNCQTSAQTAGSLGQEQSGAGGAVYVGGNSSPTFRRCNFTFNWAELGGGSAWLTDNSNATFLHCHFENESARLYGGSAVLEGASGGVFERCVWRNNWSQYGGALDSGGTSSTKLVNSLIVNSSAEIGGAVYHYTNSVNEFIGCTFIDNKATGNGGAVIVTAKSQPIYKSCTFIKNKAGGVGGVFHTEIFGKLIIDNCTMVQNSATAGGGAIAGRLNAEVTMSDCTFKNNFSGSHSGGLEIADSVMVTDRNSSFIGNTCDTDSGAALVRVNASFSAHQTRFLNNTASSTGGALRVSDSGRLSLTNVLVIGNRANRTGGGLYVSTYGSVMVADSVIANNSAEEHGGGIFLNTPYSASNSVSSKGYVTLVNTNVTYNVAEYGGGVAVDSSLPIFLQSSHLLYNRAHFGGGMWLRSAGSTMDPSSSIVGNTAERLDVDVLPSSSQFGNMDDASAQSNKSLPDGLYDDSEPSNFRGGGGGGIFHDGPGSLFSCLSYCDIRNNTASYGANHGGSPRILQPDPPFFFASPKDTFSISVSVLDAFNNTVDDTSDQMVVTLYPRSQQGAPLELIGQGLKKRVVENGVVRFGPLSVIGYLNRSYKLGLWSDGLPGADVELQIVSCGPGYQNSADPYTTPYTCHMCVNSFSRIPDSDCLPCPAGATCQGPNVTAEPGFWIDPTTPADAIPNVWRCPPGQCLGDSRCAEHRTGILCAECEENYSDWRGSGICERCDRDAPEWLLIPIIAAFIISGILLRFPSLCKSSISATLVFFVQYSSILLPASPGFEIITQSLNLAFDWINKLSGTSCILRLSNFGRILFGGFFPLTGLMSCLVWGVFIKLWYCLRGWRKSRSARSAEAGMPDGEEPRKEGAVPKEVVIAWINAFLFIVLWAYLLISRVVLRLLSCATIAGRYVVSEAPDQLCQQGAHATWWAIGWTLVVMWVIGLPVALVGFLKWALVARARGGSRFWVEALEQIYADFKPRFWFFEFVFLVRKLVVVLLDVFTLFDPVAKSLAALMFAFANILILTFLIRPWRRTRDNRVEELLLLILLLEAGLSLGESSANTTASASAATHPGDLIQRLQLAGLCLGIIAALLIAVPGVRRFLGQLRFKILGPLDEPRAKSRDKRPRVLAASSMTIHGSPSLRPDEENEASNPSHNTDSILSSGDEQEDPESPPSDLFPNSRSTLRPLKDPDVEQGQLTLPSAPTLLIPPLQSASRRGSKSSNTSVMSTMHATQKWVEEKSMSTGLLSNAHIAAASLELRRPGDFDGMGGNGDLGDGLP